MKTHTKIAVVFTGIATLVLFGVWSDETGAFERYGADNAAGSCGDPTCHGEFDGPVSTKGSTFPSDNKHEMHRGGSYMNAECNLCHTQGDGRDPFIGSSNGTSDNPGLGCTGCHEAEGLRAHHVNNGQTFCSSCHSTPSPGLESDVPTYYGTVDTAVSDPCNTVAAANTGENYTIGDFEGLDNDGDNAYDLNDSDCSATAATPGESGNDDLLVTAHDSTTGQMTLTFTSACSATDNTIHYGPLSSVSTYGYTGQVCALGTGGSTVWSYPAGSLFYVVVANDGTVEGSYGLKNLGGIESERDRDTTSVACPLPQDLTDRCD